MEESTSTFLYTATYVFVFIIATSLSIGLYFTVNRYADSAFNYSQNLNSSIINMPTTGTEIANTGKVYLSRDDVFSYYVNYVMKDIYGENSSGNQDIEYVIYFTQTSGVSDMNYLEIDSYSKLYGALQGAEQFFLEYQDNWIENGKKHVQIRIGPVK